jgi:hypothetical protein
LPQPGRQLSARISQRVAGKEVTMSTQSFEPGQVIKHYGVYRCSCGQHEFFGVSGRVFPRPHCPTGSWEMKHRAREEKFF